MSVALVALFVALGGASYAAITLPKNSVGSAQIRKSAVTSAKVKDGALLRRDFKKSERKKLVGPAGATGARGATGLQGPRGLQGPTGTVDVTAWHVVGAAGEVPFGLTFSNSDATDPLRYRREGDVVRLQGRVDSTQGGTWNGYPTRLVFTLPTGFRPPGPGTFIPITGAATTEPGAIAIQPNGDVYLNGSDSGFASFTGVTFATT
jgi:hypothetical protein